MASYKSRYTGEQIDSAIEKILNLIIDNHLNTSSENPVQNKAVTTRLNSLSSLINGKQDRLVSGTSIKTINGQTLLGSGDIVISGGGGGGDSITEIVYTPDTVNKTFTELTPNNISTASTSGNDMLGSRARQWLYDTGFKYRTSLTWDNFIGLTKNTYVIGSLRTLNTPHCSFDGSVPPSTLTTANAIFSECIFNDLSGTNPSLTKAIIVYNTTSLDIYAQGDYVLNGSDIGFSVKLLYIE